MNISTSDARGVYTKMLLEIYKEKPVVYSFLRSFFKTKEASTLELSIEVQRGSEKVAVDVVRGTLGNRNASTRSTEKIYIPPYFREYTDITQLQLYNRLFGAPTIDSAVFSAFLDAVADELVGMRDKIERAYELMCAQVLETGIITLTNDDNIDFKRKAGSLVDNSASTWATGTNNPYTHLENGCKFLRETGKSQGGVFNAIFGSSVISAFLGNDIVKSRADIRNFSLDAIAPPQKNSVGASLHGEVSVGSYNVRIWSYPEVYENSAGTITNYVNAKKVILLPENPNFVMGFAAVPQLIDEENQVPVKGAYIFEDYKDKKHATHEYHVKSAGMPIPVAVDQIYTMQVLA